MVKVLRSIVRGPLEPHVAGFAEVLLGQGYARGSAEQYLCFVAHLDRWMLAEGVAASGLNHPVLQRYLAGRRADGYRQYLSFKALKPLRDYLTSVGALPAEEPVVQGPVEELLDRYRRYLLVERGLTVGTVRGYVDCVRPFLVSRLRGGVLDLAGINAAVVNGFVLASCAGSLGLDDIDWRRGEVTIIGKGNRGERLPLPADVGAAIVAYLRDGRPTGADGRSVFVRVHAPLGPLTTGGVTMIVFDAAQRAGLGKIHAHRLRHTAATALLRAGNSLPEVGQVLRHRSAVSTAIYAKVDRDALSVLARPWPTSIQGGVS